jgi:hypothetical protein
MQRSDAMRALTIAAACLGLFAAPSYAAVSITVPHPMPMPMPGGGHGGHGGGYGGHGQGGYGHGGHGHHGGKGGVFYDPFPPSVLWTLPPPTPPAEENANWPSLPPAPVCPAYWQPPPAPNPGPRIIYIGEQPKTHGPKVKVIYGTE